MANRSGGIPTERNVTNDIMFDYESAKWLFEWLYSNLLMPFRWYSPRKGLDACCGTGVLGRALSEYVRYVDYVDIKQYAGGVKVNLIDILEFKADKFSDKYDAIICNPPWSPVDLSEKIYHHLLGLLKPHGWLYFIINYAFINTGWKRGAKLGKGIQIPLPRYTFHKSLKICKPESTGLLDPVLMINRQDSIDPPFFCPIPPEICKTDQRLLGVEN